ncbi:unnamed protein product [Absidia cylindrospora]
MSRPNSHPKIHQRKISLTSACPPTSSKQDRKSHSQSSFLQWCQRLWTYRLVRWAAYLYIIFSMLFSATQFLSLSTTDTFYKMTVICLTRHQKNTISMQHHHRRHHHCRHYLLQNSTC